MGNITLINGDRVSNRNLQPSDLPALFLILEILTFRLFIRHTEPMETLPLMLTQGANKLSTDAQPAKAIAIKKTALKPSM